MHIEDYDVSPSTGFISESLPVERLTDEYFKPWEAAVENLPALILNNQVRHVVDQQIPLLDTDRLATTGQYQRAHVILSFLAHAYVWVYNDAPSDTLPKQLSIPFIEVSNYLGIPPIATYASTVLWNFKPAFKFKEYKKVTDIEIDNFSTINTFTGSSDESWFYLISVHFEIEGAQCIKTGIKCLEFAAKNDFHNLNLYLQTLAENIDNLSTVLGKMEELCDPYVFYFKIRPFLSGWKNMKDFKLKDNGIWYEVSEDSREKELKSLSGGSNAQSSLIQFFDTLLNVKHHPTGQRPSSTTTTLKATIDDSKVNYMEDMKNYMPRNHRRFLNDLSKHCTIEKVVKENIKKHPELVLAYDACLAMLKAFRDKHIQIVTRYIVLPSQMKSSTKTLKVGLATKSTSKEMRGTGGTSLLPFLKQCRDETGDPAVGTWGKRILTGGILNLKYTSLNEKNNKIKNPSSTSDMNGKNSEINIPNDSLNHW